MISPHLRAAFKALQRSKGTPSTCPEVFFRHNTNQMAGDWEMKHEFHCRVPRPTIYHSLCLLYSSSIKPHASGNKPRKASDHA